MIIAGEHGGVNRVLRSTWLSIRSRDECFKNACCYVHTNCDTFSLAQVDT